MSPILECNVWCSENDTNTDLGLPDGDCWMPIAILLKDVISIKLAGPNDFIGNDKATINFNGQSFIIDKTYTEAVQLWKEYLEI